VVSIVLGYRCSGSRQQFQHTGLGHIDKVMVWAVAQIAFEPRVVDRFDGLSIHAQMGEFGDD
jgi:hypothetical protein